MDELESAQFLEQHPHLRLSDDFVRDFERDVDNDRSPAYDRLARGRAKQKELREAGKLKYKNPDERFAESPGSWKKAIAAFCFQCMGRAKSWRDDVEGCTSPQCPLFGFRPMKRRIVRD